jgi:ribonuclease HI
MLFIAVDAGCRETWGYMGIGAVAFRDSQRIAELSIVRRGSSSLCAELLAIGHGLNLAQALGDAAACIATDCKNCIDLVNGRDDRWSPDTQRHRRLQSLSRLINRWRATRPGWLLTWMPRDDVEPAHELATLALERYRHRWQIPGFK